MFLNLFLAILLDSFTNDDPDIEDKIEELTHEMKREKLGKLKGEELINFY